jgi:ATP-binding cassette subfamily F protein uup
VLDEPTNDLDIESLELLEDTLQAYKGTLLLVSHDRAFLDNVATQVLLAEGDGFWREYVGGWSDALRQRQASADAGTTGAAAPAGGPSSGGARGPAAAPEARVRKLGFKEQRELQELPARIEAFETEQAALAAKMADADYFRQDARVLRADQERVQAIEAGLLELLERWEILERRSKEGGR